MKNKEVEIKTIDDYNKFIKKLKYYRTIFYKNTNFIVRSNNLFKDIPHITKALNIKNRKQRIDYVYDYCCNFIDNYCKDKNFCKFKNNKCLTQYDKKYINGCCRGCRFQSVKGCKTSNLTCKLFYCSKVKEKNRIIKYEDLKIIKCLSFNNRVIIKHDFFVSREEMLKDLYLNSISIFVIKTLFRFKYTYKMLKKPFL